MCTDYAQRAPKKMLAPLRRVFLKSTLRTPLVNLYLKQPWVDLKIPDRFTVMLFAHLTLGTALGALCTAYVFSGDLLNWLAALYYSTSGATFTVLSAVIAYVISEGRPRLQLTDRQAASLVQALVHRYEV